MKIESYTIDASFCGYLKVLFYIIAMAAGAAFDYIGIERVIIYTLTGLMIADWITGVLKSWKLGISITSKRSSKGILEKFVLLIIPIAISLTLKTIGIPIGITVKAAFSLMMVAELYSLIGNCYCIYTGEEEKEFDAMTAVIKYIRGAILRTLKKLLGNKDGNT